MKRAVSTEERRPAMRADDPARRAAAHHIRAILRQRHGERLTLRELGETLDLSPFQILRIFQRDFGVTPHAYLVRFRVGLAAKMLRAGQPIAQVATEVGFTDQSHMAKHFKKQLGVTPSEYRGGACRPA